MTSPAVNLLLAAVRHRYGAATDQDVVNAAAGIAPAGWDGVFAAARVHAVTPLLDLGMAQAAAEIPADAAGSADGAESLDTNSIHATAHAPAYSVADGDPPQPSALSADDPAILRVSPDR